MDLSIIHIVDDENAIFSLKNILSHKEKKDIQLVVINRMGKEMDDKILKVIRPEDKILHAEKMSLTQSIKMGLNYAKNEFVSIALYNPLYEKRTFKEVFDLLSKVDNEVICIKTNNFSQKEHDVVTTNYLPKGPLLSSYIVKKEILENLQWNADLCDFETSIELILQLVNNYQICYTNRYGLHYIDLSFLKNDSVIKSYYIPAINRYIQIAKNTTLNLEAQKIIYFSIYYKFHNNKNGAHKELLNPEEKKELFAKVGELLKFIDVSIITNTNSYAKKHKLLYEYKYLMFYLRDGIQTYSMDMDDQGIYATINGTKVYVNSDLVKIAAMNYKNKKLKIYGYYEYYELYEFAPEALYAVVNGKNVQLKATKIYSMTKYFAISTSKEYTFELEVPIDTDLTSISFKLNLQGKTVKMPLSFTKTGARLTNRYKNSYWAYKDIIVKYKNDNLVVKKYSKVEVLKSELIYYFDLIKKSKKWFKVKTVALRTLYWLLKPFYYKKRIWIYFDKLYKAGDNGEYLIEYTSKLNDGINHYYVLNADSYDMKNLKKENINVLKFNSIKHKLMCLYAENIVATHPDIIGFCGFGFNMEKAFRGLFNGNIICIAHGLTIQKNAEVQNKLYDNTMFYTTSSKYEVNHITSDVYGYTQDEVALTGMARLDKMISKTKRQILITPTWRRSVSGTASMNHPKGYNSQFKDTTYFKIYNSLINDEKLLSCAEKCNYKIIFLLHPAMSSQIDDYDKNEHVTILQASDDIQYHEILGESDLMVTDYSGVQYDFAYMHKPIVYYHPSLLPPRFEEGALKYDTMGFGPICKDHDEIISCLINYINNNCKIEKKYDDRIKDFFAFDDYSNCERIYKAILDFTNKI